MENHFTGLERSYIELAFSEEKLDDRELLIVDQIGFLFESLIDTERVEVEYMDSMEE